MRETDPNGGHVNQAFTISSGVLADGQSGPRWLQQEPGAAARPAAQDGPSWFRREGSRKRDRRTHSGKHGFNLANTLHEIPRVESAGGISVQSTVTDVHMMDGISQVELQKVGREEDSGGSCGWACFRPSCLQRFRTPKWLLFWLCWAAALQGMVVNGFVNVVITTIERRFDLRSTETGVIAGGYDIASLLFGIPVSYFGGRKGANKSKWIALGVLVMGIGSLIFSLPHFTTELYKGSSQAENLCHLYTNASSECTGDRITELAKYKYVFILGQLLHGAGASPLYTLGITYIDESVKTKVSSVYLGIYYTMAIIGPAVGYVMGGQFLKIYTDVGFVNPTTLGLTSDSDVWVGAWWIGFLLSGIFCFLVTLPIMAFPGSLPGSKALQAEKVSEAYQGDSSRNGGMQMGFGTLKEMPQATKALVLNPTFTFLSLAGASEGLILAGLAAFLPKLIESQFSLAASWASLIVGFITVPAGGGGTFLGGYLVKRLNLRCAGIIKLCIVSTMCALGCSLCFLFTCPDLRLAGVNVHYGNSSQDVGSPTLLSSCNIDCSCNQAMYDPICGVNNIMYYSPCFAGCQEMYTSGEMKVFGNCKCIPGPPEEKTLDGSSKMILAMRQKCTNDDCNLMAPFLVFLFFAMLFTFITSMPALSATLRCVQDNQRSFALGIQWIEVRLLGTIPAPIVLGALIDLTCVNWQESCGVWGSCRAYDNFAMSRYTLLTLCVAKMLSLLFFGLAWWMYKPPNNNPPEAAENAGATALKTGAAEPKDRLGNGISQAVVQSPNTAVKEEDGNKTLRQQPGIETENN